MTLDINLLSLSRTGIVPSLHDGPSEELRPAKVVFIFIEPEADNQVIPLNGEKVQYIGCD